MCLIETIERFSMALCNEFVKRSLFQPSNRAAFYDMAVILQQGFIDIIRENDWNSEITKVTALAKVEGMKLFVGYSDLITNDTWVAEQFRAVGGLLLLL